MKTLSTDPYNLVVTGVGGQGNVLISQILGQAFLNMGYRVAVGETFGLSQRGGSVQSHIRISESKEYGPLIPENQAHFILGLEPMEALRVLPAYGQPGIGVIVNTRPIPPLNVIAGEARYPDNDELKKALDQLAAQVWWINATAAAQELGAAIMANITALGALTAANVLPLESQTLESAMKEIIPTSKLEMNVAAFRKGMTLLPGQ